MLFFLFMDPDEMDRAFWLFALLSEIWFRDNVNRGTTTFITIAAIMAGVFITIIILKIKFGSSFSRPFSSQSYSTPTYYTSRFRRRKKKDPLKELNYTCQFCKAPLKEAVCEYCGRKNFN